MKMNYFRGFAAVLAAGVAFSAVTVLAQDATTDASAAATSAPAPQFAYGVSQILQLSQAKVPDDTIVNYIRSSGSSYGLTADQIIYLRQHAVSSTVINAMLTQPRAGVTGYASAPAPEAAMPPVPATPAPAPVYQDQPAPTVVVTPPVTGIDPSAAAYYYSYPYYYPSYGYYSPVVFTVGWGRGWGGNCWRGGSGWRGPCFRPGFGGGFHGNVGFGGGFRGGGGGGFHGGVGGGFHGGGRR